MVSEYKPAKLFTREQANKTLPLVRRIVQDIQDSYRQMAERAVVYQQVISSEPSAEHDLYRDEVVAIRDELEGMQETLQGYVKELGELGVELKGPDAGLVDFPSMRDGRIVYLCWKLGEPEVQYWHELEAGFRGRQPLETVDSST